MASISYISRTIEPLLREAAQYFSVVALTGPRQSGKTTLLRQLFPDYKRYSLKDLDVREFAHNDPVAFLRQTSEGMLIDEVQLVPQLLEYMQGIVDDDPSRRFAITGSSNFRLLQHLSESLAGRAAVFELLPMSLSESAEQCQPKSVDKLLFDGLYPAVVAGKNIARLFYPAYVRTYIQKDVRDFLQVSNQLQFMKFLKLCAGRIGALFNASEVGNEVGVESKTITRWLSVLQASYLITLLPPYYENISKRLVKTPKLYFNDTGLACHLLDIDRPEQLAHDKMRGALFENMMVMECIKRQSNLGKEGNVFFYRDSNQNEVDILIKSGGKLTALEVKSAMTYSKSFDKSLRSLPSWVNTPIEHRAVVYAGTFENTVADVQVLNFMNLSTILPS